MQHKPLKSVIFNDSNSYDLFLKLESWHREELVPAMNQAINNLHNVISGSFDIGGMAISGIGKRTTDAEPRLDVHVFGRKIRILISFVLQDLVKGEVASITVRPQLLVSFEKEEGEWQPLVRGNFDKNGTFFLEKDKTPVVFTQDYNELDFGVDFRRLLCDVFLYVLHFPPVS